MQLSFIFAAIVGATAVVGTAIPEVEERTTKPVKQFQCGSALYSSELCCATDVLGVADLDCAAPPRPFTTKKSFKKVCASIGQRARCCVLPILGQGILCQAPN